MPDITKLELSVRDLYEAKAPNRDRWADWMYENHVIDVADRAVELAKRFNAPVDVCRSAALLHDIADAVMAREDSDNKKQNMIIAENLLEKAGFSSEDKKTILGDALPYHSCHGDERPQTLVGKILSTADAMSHLLTEFYAYFDSELAIEESKSSMRQYAAKRLSRDYYKKIAFEEIREETRERYEELVAKYA